MRIGLPRLLAVIAFVATPPAVCGADEKADAEAGAEVYAENCASCHGEQLRNQGQAFDLRKLEPTDRARFDKAVQEGRANMPPWRGVLTDQQIDQIWTYVMVNSR